ncbi:MAG TPA: hypothetical protein VIK17_01980 [Cellulomonas sp.]
MDALTSRWARLGLAVAAAVMLAALVFPASALAKSATRFVVTKQVIADWSTPGSTPATSVVYAKLQKKVGSRWVALKGSVKVYFKPTGQTGWTYLYKQTSSSVKVSMPLRGQYKVYYSGTSRIKAATGYTKRLDRIGESIAPAVISIVPLDATWTGVTVSYDLTWNAEAYPELTDAWPLEFEYDGWFGSTDNDRYSGDVWFYQELWEPGTVQFSYRVRTEDLPLNASDQSELYTIAKITSTDPYVLATVKLEESRPYTPNL